MTTASLVLWVNPDANALMSEWNSTSVLSTPTFKQGDTIRLELHLVKMTTSAGKVMEEIPWSPSTNITLAIGRVQALPTFGTYTLSFGSNETTPIAFNATAEEVQDAINAMAGVTAIGGVSVSLQGTAYRVIFQTAGVLPFALNYNENDLFPTSSIGVVEARAGSPTVRAIYQVQIKQSPVASLDTFTGNTLSVATSTVLKSSAFAGDTKVWRVSLSPAPKDGSFNLAFTDSGSPFTTSPIDPEARSFIMQSALNNANGIITTDWTVTSSKAYEWDISTTKATISALTVNGGGLFDYSGKVGLLSLNTVEVENLLAGEASVSAVLEIEADTNGSRHTLLQTTVTIVNDLIDEADYTVVSRTEVMPVDSVVRYDTGQTLTNAQKLQARTNIGASSSTVDVDALELTVGNIDTRLSNIEGISLNADQYGAIQWSDLPTATNQFITESALTLSLNDYSLTGHTHILADVTGLQTALDAKAGIVHTHITDEVTGLDDALLALTNSLAGKANISHLHTIASISGLSEQLADYVSLTDLLPYLAQKANTNHTQSISTISGLPDQLQSMTTTTLGINVRLGNLETTVWNLTANNFEARLTQAEADIVVLQETVVGAGANYGGFTNGGFLDHYPYEIRLKIFGTTYAIPARIP